jgi:hypothetical protein
MQAQLNHLLPHTTIAGSVLLHSEICNPFFAPSHLTDCVVDCFPHRRLQVQPRPLIPLTRKIWNRPAPRVRSEVARSLPELNILPPGIAPPRTVGQGRGELTCPAEQEMPRALDSGARRHSLPSHPVSSSLQDLEAGHGLSVYLGVSAPRH